MAVAEVALTLACDNRGLPVIGRIPAVSPYELAVGLRYTRARKGSGRNTFISFISLISMAGIALGVAALIVVLSVMNGFQEELRNRILSVASHIEIRGVPQLMDWASRGGDRDRREPQVKAAAPYVIGQAMLTASDANRGAIIRGIDPAREDTVADIGKHMRAGALADLKPGEFGIVLGGELARALGVGGAIPSSSSRRRARSRPRARCRASRASRWSASSRSGCTSSTAGSRSSTSRTRRGSIGSTACRACGSSSTISSPRRPSRATCGRSFRCRPRSATGRAITRTSSAPCRSRSA